MPERLRFLSFEHVPQEGIGALQDYIDQHQGTFSAYRQYLQPGGPVAHSDYDVLVVMGGPMGVYDVADYPWLEMEIRFIQEALEHDKHVIGICLGAQLIAAALGAQVNPGPYQEIGWSPVRFTPEFLQSPLGRDLPEQLEVLHWHGDTFAIPEGALRVAQSDAYPNQGFLYRDKVLALQFHIEMGLPEVAVMVDHFAHQLQPDRFVQSAAELQAGTQLHAEAARQAYFKILKRWLDS